MTGKSASVQNFEHLVKQMINGTRQGNDQLIEFHRTIGGNCCMNKLSESHSTDREGNDTKELEMNQRTSSTTNISATIAHRRSRRPKYKRSSSRQVQSTDDKDDINISQLRSTYLSHSKEQIRTINDNEDHFSQPPNIPLAPAVASAANVIEIWSKSPQRINRLPNANVTDVNVPGEQHQTLDHVHSLSTQKQNEPRLSFDAWKRKKTIAYQHIIKKIETEQQQKLLKDMQNLEWKKAAHQNRIRKKEEAENQRRKKLLSQKPLFEIADHTDAAVKSNSNKCGQRQDFDRYASKVANECKQTTLVNKKRNANVPMARSSKKPKIQRNNINSTLDESTENVKFNSWLNQVNWILHKKYLRERRYLVRSFYCQPFYYGNANFCAR